MEYAAVLHSRWWAVGADSLNVSDAGVLGKCASRLIQIELQEIAAHLAETPIDLNRRVKVQMLDVRRWRNV